MKIHILGERERVTFDNLKEEGTPGKLAYKLVLLRRDLVLLDKHIFGVIKFPKSHEVRIRHEKLRSETVKQQPERLQIVEHLHVPPLQFPHILIIRIQILETLFIDPELQVLRRPGLRCKGQLIGLVDPGLVFGVRGHLVGLGSVIWRHRRLQQRVLFEHVHVDRRAEELQKFYKQRAVLLNEVVWKRDNPTRDPLIVQKSGQGQAVRVQIL